MNMKSAGGRRAGIIKEFFRNIRGVDKRVLAGVCAAVLLCASMGIIARFYTLAYDVYYEGEYVGVVSGKREALAACEAAGITEGARFVLRIAPTASIGMTNIYPNLVAASTDAKLCVSLVCGGETVVSLESKEDAEAAVKKYAESFEGKYYEIVSDYEITADAKLPEEIKSVSEAAEIIAESGKITVRYEKTTDEDISIPREVRYVEDDSMLKGVEVTEREGADGVERITRTAVYENDLTVEMIKKDKKVISEPEEMVVRIGTGEGGLPEAIPCPVSGALTSSFGERWGRNHNGIDIGAPIGTPVYAPCDGKVVFAGEKNGYGNYIRLDHGFGYVTCYAHLNEIKVTEGQTVAKGELIGTVGVTGRVTGPHLHFEIMKDGGFVDPETYIIEG